MPAPRSDPQYAEVTSELSGIATGLGIITMTLSPLALPGLLLALPVVVLIAPLALVGAIAYLLFRILAVPVRRVRAALRERTGADASPESELRAVQVARDRRIPVAELLHSRVER
jgi:hypothetical protein